MNVVIVDDSRAMRMIVRKTLRHAGYGHADVREASNGLEAMELVRTWAPDLLMTDWNMPDMGGRELLEALRVEEFKGAAGVVSSVASPDMRAAATAAGAVFVLQKPFTARGFQDAIRLTGFEPKERVEVGEVKSMEFALDANGVDASLSGAYQRPLTITPVPDINLRRLGKCVLATFEEDEEVNGLALVEMELAAALAAGLSLIPAHVAKSCIETGEFNEELRSNLAEACNLLSRIIGTEEKAAQLASVEIGVDVPLFARGFVRKGRRCDVRIEVQGYGAGRICLAAR